MAERRVLVVDDNQLLLDLLELMLETLGYDVTTAITPDEALKQVDSRAPDLVLVNWMMPEIDGGTFCRQLRRRLAGSAKQPAFLLMSADDRVRSEAVELGLDGWLVKPFDLDQLIACLASTGRAPGTEETPTETIH